MLKAIQQFQLGTVLNNKKQAENTLRKIKEAGFDGIELCSFMIHPASLAVKLITNAAGMPVGNGGSLNWPELIKKFGLIVPAVHYHLDTLENEIKKAVSECGSFGTDTIVVTGMYRFDYSEKNGILKLADRLNKAGAKLKENGIRLLYHNHNAEFIRIDDTLSAYSLLINETEAENVNFEFDSFWCADAGCSPLEQMQLLGSRMKLWHINDRGCRKVGFTPIYKMDSMELGTGCMNLDSLIAQAGKCGCEAVILESHRNWIDNDPVKSFQISADYLNEKV